MMQLKDLGNFNYDEVIESYFICGKNEEINLRNEKEANKNNH